MQVFPARLNRSHSLPYLSKATLSWLSLSLLFFCSFSALAKEQMVSISAASDRFYLSESFNAIVFYETSDKGLATGIGIRVHFDSSQLSIDSIASMLREAKVGTQVKQDFADFDNDPSTDKYLNAGWADMDGAWPEFGIQPLELLKLKVTTSADFSGSNLNITISSSDVNYSVSASNLLIRLAK